MRMDDGKLSDNILTIDKNLDSIAQKGTQKLDTVLTNVKDQLVNQIPNDSSKAEIVTDLNKVFDIVNQETKKQGKSVTGLIKIDTAGTLNFGQKIKEFNSFQKDFPTYTTKQALDSMGYAKTFWNRFYYQSAANVQTNWNQIDTKNGKKQLFKKLTSYISISLFIFLPVFTLFLKLLYIRRRFTYMEHLVFVFHTQTVFFLLLIIFFIINYFVPLTDASWVFILLFLLYLYKALRNFYKQSRIKSLIKFMLLNSYYLFLAIVGFSIVGVLSFIMN